jgi:hypothetical protein
MKEEWYFRVKLLQSRTENTFKREYLADVVWTGQGDVDVGRLFAGRWE